MANNTIVGPISSSLDAVVAVLLVNLVQRLLLEDCRQYKLERLLSPIGTEDQAENNPVFLQ